MANLASKVLAVAKNEVGYLEKKSNSQLDDKTANAGSANYTKYWRDISKWGLGDFQAQYWCAAFITWCFVIAYGLEAAKVLLLHLPYISCQTLADLARWKGKLISTPKVGSIVLFWNGSRYSHTELVWKVTGTMFYTYGGNTSGGSTVVSNGGGVASKSYNTVNMVNSGARFFMPDYDVEVAESYPKWVQLENDWYYRTASGVNAHGWVDIPETADQKNIHRYYFDKTGKMMVNWFQVDDAWYYAQPDGALQGALYRSDSTGVQSIWYL